MRASETMVNIPDEFITTYSIAVTNGNPHIGQLTNQAKLGKSCLS